MIERNKLCPTCATRPAYHTVEASPKIKPLCVHGETLAKRFNDRLPCYGRVVICRAPIITCTMPDGMHVSERMCRECPHKVSPDAK